MKITISSEQLKEDTEQYVRQVANEVRSVCDDVSTYETPYDRHIVAVCSTASEAQQVISMFIPFLKEGE